MLAARQQALQLLGGLDVVEHEQPAPIAAGEPVQRRSGTIARREPVDSQAESDGEAREIGDPAVLGADPRHDVVRAASRLGVAGCELALADAAEARDRLGDERPIVSAELRVEGGELVLAAGERRRDRRQVEPHPPAASGLTGRADAGGPSVVEHADERCDDVGDRAVDVAGHRDRAVADRVVRPLHALKLVHRRVAARAHQRAGQRHLARDERRQLLLDDERRSQEVRADEQQRDVRTRDRRLDLRPPLAARRDRPVNPHLEPEPATLGLEHLHEALHPRGVLAAVADEHDGTRRRRAAVVLARRSSSGEPNRQPTANAIRRGAGRPRSPPARDAPGAGSREPPGARGGRGRPQAVTLGARREPGRRARPSGEPDRRPLRPFRAIPAAATSASSPSRRSRRPG